eukprot:TRINITY_DN5777_c0_g2_i1.p2 TRINITY_DN5777_c0_g2~~TRINITY_DN5777_c0_g2_i1.p2  ORF type:complete len:136 (-),score=44.22 TRINITY_DN5777_c0_g2_i1:1050-1457(-)
MSYTNVVPGRLKLKGKALDVKNGGVKKKKQRRTDEGLLLLQQEQQLKLLEERSEQEATGEEAGDTKEGGSGEQQLAILEDHRTPAEKIYDDQRAKLEARRLAKMGSKSHRQKVEEFNQYLANLSEHYDIPKVGPG